MHYRLTLSLFLLLAFIVVPACKKEKDPVPTITNNEKIIGTWTLLEELQDPNNNGQFVNILHACDLDDTWTFATDNTLTGSQNGTTCDPGSPDGFTTRWELQDDQTVLYLDFTATFSKYKIAVLDEHTLTLHRPRNLNDINGAVYSKITYKR